MSLPGNRTLLDWIKLQSVTGGEFAAAEEAVHFANINRLVVIRIDNRILVVRRQDADRLEAQGIAFIYLMDGYGNLY